MNTASYDVLVPARTGFFSRLVYQHAPAVGLISYLIILMLPWWWLSDWWDLRDARATSAALSYQVAGFAVFTLSVLPLAIRTLGRNEFVTLRTPRGVFIAVFFTFCLAFLVLTDVPSWRPAVYAILTWALFISGAAFWSADDRVVKRALGWAGLAVLAFLVLLLLKHGLSNPGTARRAVGGIQPNHYGRAALVGLVLVFFLPRALAYAGAALAVGLMILVSSRSALLAAAVFLLCYGCLTAWSINSFPLLLRFVTLALAFAAAMMTLELYFLYERGAGFLALVADRVLLIDDPTRGLDSGFTGRTERWVSGLHAVAERPFFGYGFRRTVGGAHSGYINLMLDVGIPMAAWFVVFVMVEVGRRIAAIGRLRIESLKVPENRDLWLLHRVIGAYLVATLVTWIFEPNYLNLGTANVVLFLVFLAAPHRLLWHGQAHLPASHSLPHAQGV